MDNAELPIPTARAIPNFHHSTPKQFPTCKSRTPKTALHARRDLATQIHVPAAARRKRRQYFISDPRPSSCGLSEHARSPLADGVVKAGGIRERVAQRSTEADDAAGLGTGTGSLER